MKKINNYLHTIGLSKTEATIYVAGLKSPITVDELVAQTDIKRSTIYHALDTLRTKGLVSVKRLEGKLLFTMTAAENITRYLESRAKEIELQHAELDRLLPLFPSAHRSNGEGYRTEHYASIEGVKKVIETALDCHTPEWRIIAPRDNFISQYDEEYAKYYLSRRRSHKIKAKTLWERPTRSGHKSTLTLGDVSIRNPRYLSEQHSGMFTSMIILFDNKIAFISPLKNAEAVLIDSVDYANTMKVMFDALWDASSEVMSI